MCRTGKNHLSFGEDAEIQILRLGVSIVTATWGGILATCFKPEDAHIHHPVI